MTLKLPTPHGVHNGTLPIEPALHDGAIPLSTLVAHDTEPSFDGPSLKPPKVNQARPPSFRSGDDKIVCEDKGGANSVYTWNQDTW